MQYLPLFVKLTDKPVLIIGGGSVALRKAGTLLGAGARLTVVAKQFTNDFVQWQQQGKATLIHGSFDPVQLDGMLLVIAATDDDQLNDTVYQAATARNMLVNTVDDQPKCSFIFPSIIDRSPILIAISSFGTAPVLARRLREKLEALLPQHLGPLAQLVGRFRSKVKVKISGFAARRQFWEQVFDSDVVRDVQANQLQQAEQRLEQLLAQPQQQAGEVYVVGAGPGDPELLTLKALQLMQQADLILEL